MSSDWTDLLNCFDAHGVKYLVVGGHAVMFYSEPRFTKDLDLWIEATPENARNVYQSLAEFGAPLKGLSPADFASPGAFYQLGRPPLRIDILMSIEGLSFSEAWPNRHEGELFGRLVPFIGRKDLIRNKQAVGRTIDLHDAEILSAAAANETVVVVDRDNNITGSATRRQMRAERLPHRCSYILVFNSQGQLYVQKRTMIKDIYPGYWDPAAGGVMQVGETYEENAVREVGEELGVRGVELRPLFDLWFEDERSAVWGRAFTCIYDGLLTLQAEEVQFVEMMAPDEVLRRAAAGERFTPDGLAVVERYLRSAQST